MEPANKGLRKAECDKVMTKGEVARLLAMAGADERVTGPRNYMMLSLMANTGIREGETVSLKVGDVILEKPLIKVRHGKGGYPRDVYMNGKLKALLARWIKGRDGEEPLFRSQGHGGHLTTRAVRKVFSRYAKQAGLNPLLSLHSLRHFYGCQAFEARRDVIFVARQMGHRSLDTTQVYVHLVNQREQAAGVPVVL